MRIGIDLCRFDPAYAGGVSTFTMGLVEGLLANLTAGKKLILFVSQSNATFLTKKFSDRNVLIYRVPRPRLAQYVNRGLLYVSWLLRDYRLRYWYELLFRRKVNLQIERLVDALIVPTTTFNFYALRVPTILCIHDIQQEYHPENFTFHERVLRWAPYRLSCERATTIQVSSQYIKICLLEKFVFLSPEKFLIAPEGVDTNLFTTTADQRAPRSLPKQVHENFVFYPAQIWKHKNHALLMYALDSFRALKGFEIPCVLTGYDYGNWAEIDRLRKALDLRSVFYLGRVDLNEILWLYENCTALLALGLHESSSLPLREGACFGKPLICTDIPPNIEASAYLNLNLFEKSSPESLASVLVAIHDNSDTICRLAAQNKSLVVNLCWEKIASLYLDRLVDCANHAYCPLE